jgi:SNF2 family DNA or RNA helicase
MRSLHIRGARAAGCRFQSEAGCRVLLMQMANHTGAAGLNLTCASHAYIMEPAMSPAIEAQAAARIYRLGERQRAL